MTTNTTAQPAWTAMAKTTLGYGTTALALVAMVLIAGCGGDSSFS